MRVARAEAVSGIAPPPRWFPPQLTKLSTESA